MNWKNSFLILCIVFSSCKEDEKKKVEPSHIEIGEPFSYLIEATDLQKIYKNDYIKIIDFRKKEAYQNEHISEAINIWRKDIEDPKQHYGGVMATKEQIEKLFTGLGIRNEDTLVIYDDNGLCDSARLWWVLQNYDFKNVRLLHGGIDAWKLVNGPTSQKDTKFAVSKFTLPSPNSARLYASKEDVLQALRDSVFILDTRTIDEFSGKRKKEGAYRGGRIPSSKLIHWAEAINEDDDKRLKSVTELIEIYSSLNLSKDDPIIVYCHSGVRSAHTTFVLTQLLGYTDVKNYDGSWTEWSYFHHLPKQKDSITTILK